MATGESSTRFSRFKRGAFVQFRAFGLQGESQFFIQNLSILTGAGMGITAAIESVLEETSSRRMRSAIKEVLSAVDEGKPLSVALDNAHIITPYVLALVKTGERSGRLSDNLAIASAQNEKEAEFRSRVRSALSYSSFVLVIAVVVGTGTAWYILPQIATFFTSFKVPLPLVTRIIINTGLFLKTYGFIFVPLVIASFLGLFYFLFSFPKTRFIGHTILFHIPLFKDLIRDTEVARFGFISGTMLRAGIPLQDIFKILPETTTFTNYRNLYEFMGARVEEGLSFKRIFPLYSGLSKVFPGAVRQMIVAAEQSGALSDTLIKIGSLYEVKVEAVSRNIPTFLEPALLIIIGGIVATLALGILIPVYRIGLYF